MIVGQSEAKWLKLRLLLWSFLAWYIQTQESEVAIKYA